MPDPMSNKFEKYCDIIQESIHDDNRFTKSLKEVFDLLDNVLNNDYDRASAKTLRLVNAVKNAI